MMCQCRMLQRRTHTNASATHTYQCYNYANGKPYRHQLTLTSENVFFRAASGTIPI